MKLFALVIASVLSVMVATSFARAEVVTCQGTTIFNGKIQVVFDTQRETAHVVVPGALDERFRTSDIWDGHMTGLATAPGLSIKYENIYGCFRNVIVTTDVRGGGIGYIDAMKFELCPSDNKISRGCR